MENETTAITTSDDLKVARQKAAVLRLALRSLPIDKAGDILDELVAISEAVEDLCNVLAYTSDIHARSALETGFKSEFAGLLVAGPAADEEIH